ncbi:dna excision repair protein [Stemphylium lycopersici]|uniref:Dna excision repair protein n=1 Tax=Stemphylium lycopersici TaxID=183478 RepID=A0A364NHG4_STELY|nr:dna excision repair protein [Stemphylium lycopersici]
MPSPTFLSGLFGLISLASAAPGIPGRMIRRQNGPDGCANDLDGQPYIADVGFYSDSDCTEKFDHVCIFTYEGTANGNPGDYGCNPGLLPDTTPFWGKVEDSPYDEMQIVFTRDQTCPPNGPGAVFATLIDNPSCVQFNLGGDAPGISIFPNGGSGIARIANVTGGPPEAAAVAAIPPSPPTLRKRDSKCDGFDIESSVPSTSQTVQVSNIVDCINGAESGCTITVGSEHTESVSTSYSLSAGGGIEGIFSVEATFGMEYTESSTTSLQEGFSVQQGQKGYLAAYSAATLFRGTYTGCDEGDAEQPGEALVIKKEGFTYNVVNTGT